MFRDFEMMLSRVIKDKTIKKFIVKMHYYKK